MHERGNHQGEYFSVEARDGTVGGRYGENNRNKGGSSSECHMPVRGISGRRVGGEDVRVRKGRTRTEQQLRGWRAPPYVDEAKGGELTATGSDQQHGWQTRH